jgi:hypothetical protein
MTRNREAILRLFRVSHDRAAAYEPRDKRPSCAWLPRIRDRDLGDPF